jgi:hypothetical protein
MDDTFDLRMERAATEGAVNHSPTLGPFVAEIMEQAKADLDATEREIESWQSSQQFPPAPVAP